MNPVCERGRPGWYQNLGSRCLQVATVSEKSRIIELQKDLTLKEKEVAALREHLETPGQEPTGDPTAPVLQAELILLRTQLSAQATGHERELTALRRKLDEAEKATQENLSKLEASSRLLAQEKEKLLVQLSEAEKEKTDAIEQWRSKLESAVISHQRTMEDLKASLSKEAGESQSEHGADVTRFTKEVEELRRQLNTVTEEKERLVESLRSNLDSTETQHLVELEEALGKLHTFEVKVKELEEKNAKLEEQVQGKTREIQDQDEALQRLRSQQSQGNQEVQSLVARVEEAEGKARVQDGKVILA